MWTHAQVLHALGVKALIYPPWVALSLQKEGEAVNQSVSRFQWGMVLTFDITGHCNHIVIWNLAATLDVVQLDSKSFRKWQQIYSLLVSTFFSENKPKNGGICVANHTSPIDVIILASDGCYAMVITPLPSRKHQKHRHWSLFRHSCLSGNLIFLPEIDLLLFSCPSLLCSSGWSNSRWPDGSHSEIHGQGLPTCLVRTLRSQRQTSSGQEVELQPLFFI